MSRMSDDKLNQLLKSSPTYTPPERFYRAVMKKIDRAKEQKEGTSWWGAWGLPAKSLAMACVLFVMVWVARDRGSESRLMKVDTVVTKESNRKPEVAATSEVQRISVPSASPASKDERRKRTDTESDLDLRDELKNNKAVQSRIHRDISGYVDKPSPFEDAEEKETNDKLVQLANEDFKKQKTMEKKVMSPKPVLLEARNTATGSAAQSSFMQQEKALANAAGLKRDENQLAAANEDIVAQAPAAAAEVYSYTTNGKRLPQSRQQFGLDTAYLGAKAGGMSAPQTAVLRSPAEWTSFLESRRGGRGVQKAPSVNFDQDMLLVVSLGDRPSAGYSVDIVNVVQEKDRIIVQYRETIPPAGTVAAQVITHPYTTKVIPKSDKEIVFQKLDKKE